MSTADGSSDPTTDPDIIDLATTVFDFARNGDTEPLGAYIAAGVPVNLTNDSGDTLVMLASYHGHADTVAHLCRHGADVDRLNDRGQSPLAGAVFKGEDDVVAVLVEHGADPQAGTPSATEAARMFDQRHYLELFGDQDH